MNRNVFFFCLISLLACSSGRSQSSSDTLEIKKQLAEIKEAQTTIRQQLDAIASALHINVAASLKPGTTLNVENLPYIGSPDAKLTLIEFSDPQCPYCAKHYRDTFPLLRDKYVQTGELRYVIRDFPLDEIHPDANRAAVACRCSGDQGKYWNMREKLLLHQDNLKKDAFLKFANDLHLDIELFARCLDTTTPDQKIRDDRRIGESIGVAGTPTFFLGFSRKDSNSVEIIRRFDGAVPFDQFQQAIESLLNLPGKTLRSEQ